MKKASILLLCAVAAPVSALGQWARSGVSFCGSVHPEVIRQFSVCALVEPASACLKRLMTAQCAPGSPEERQILTFDVRAVKGAGLTVGRIYHCLALPDFPVAETPAGRYLLLGWSNCSEKKLALLPETLADRLDKTQPLSAAVEPDTLLAYTLVPIHQERLLKGTSDSTTAILNLDEALRDALPSTLRQITDQFVSLPEAYEFASIEGGEPVSWIKATVGETLLHQPQKTDLDLGDYLRCGKGQITHFPIWSPFLRLWSPSTLLRLRLRVYPETVRMTSIFFLD